MSMNITMIETNKLYHHPRNPRADYGDLEELSNSIAGMGVLQNLTVVPFDAAKHTGLTVDDPEQSFVVIIGNRRLEAAKLAGCPSVPCAVKSNLTLTDELAAMLSENNLRSDASPRKEAENLQLMLDMGETTDSLSRKTGFSTTKIRTRLKLLDLDVELMEKASAKGITLSDYAALNSVKSPEKKNRILEQFGTPNFTYSLNNAIQEEKEIEATNNMYLVALQFASALPELDELSKYKFLKSWNGYEKKKIKRPDVPEGTPLFVVKHERNLSIFTLRTEADSQQQQIAAQQEQERFQKQSVLEDITFTSFQTRFNFVKQLTQSQVKRHWSDLVPVITKAMTENMVGCHYSRDWAILNELLSTNSKDNSLVFDTANAACVKTPELFWFYMAYSIMDSNSLKYYYLQYRGNQANNYVFLYKENKALDTLYKLLTDVFGYQKADAEKALSEGTHPLLDTDNSKDGTPEASDIKAAS